MKTQDLINAFGDIDEEFFAECADTSAMEGSADLLGSKPEKIRIYKEPLRIRARRYAVSAAAIVCALAVGAAAGAHFTTARIQSASNSNNSDSSASIIQSTSPLDQNISNIPNIPTPNSKYTYLTLDEIREQAKTTPLSNDKLTIDTVRIGSGSAMPAYTPSHSAIDLNAASAAARHLFGEDFPLEEPYIEFYENGDQEYVTFYNNGYNPKYGTSKLFYSNDGHMYLDPEASHPDPFEPDEPYRNYQDFKTKQHFKLYMGDDPGDLEYMMNDGQRWKVSDAVDYAENFADTCFSPLENNEFNYKVTDVRVKSLNNGSCGYVMNIQRVDKNGNLYDNHNQYANRHAFFITDKTFRYNTDCWLVEGNPWLFGSDIEIFFIDKEAPHVFSLNSAPAFGEELASGEKLLSFDDAVNIVSAAPLLSENYPYSGGKLEFDTAELEYYIISTGCPEYTGPDYIGPLSDGEVEMMNSDYAQIRPYWAFTMKGNYAETASLNQTVTATYDHALYLVDAVTGELHVI
ncbi:MAG: hypothetical protein K2N56_07300 [Oscillospiraceae bacterium]|nr:hypothetical protein [Oscillospiraceae bacterium]